MPEKEYIEREALIKNLNTFAPEHYSALINMLITKQPTADVAEVKHGEWVFEYDTYGNMICSLCKEEALLNNCNEYVDSNYCPNCGADMRKEDNNG